MSTVSSLEDGVRKPKGAVLFTGPDGIGNHRTSVTEQRYVGHGSKSPESSSDTQYLCRSAPTCPHPPPKSARVGEVGWGVPSISNNALLKSGHQIQLKVFRQAVEDRHTHLYQNPYYPPPPLSRPSQPATIEDTRASDESLKDKTDVNSVHSAISTDTTEH